MRYSVNWIITHWTDNFRNDLTRTYHWGTADIALDGHVVVTTQYGANDYSYWGNDSGLSPYTPEQNGVSYLTAGGYNYNAKAYFTADGGVTYKNRSEDQQQSLFFPQPDVPIVASDLGDVTYRGIQSDSTSWNGIDDVKHVEVTPVISDDGGVMFSLKDVRTGLVTDTITISSSGLNPSNFWRGTRDGWGDMNGVMLGTVERSRATGEAWVRAVKHECLDHFLVFGERHLQYLLDEYVTYFHEQRPHQGLGNRPPIAEPSSPEVLQFAAADVVRQDRLGGLLKQYERKAA